MAPPLSSFPCSVTSAHSLSICSLRFHFSTPFSSVPRTPELQPGALRTILYTLTGRSTTARLVGQRRAGYVTPLVRGDYTPTASEAATVGACPASRSLIPHVWTLDHCIPLSTRSRLGFAEGQRAVAVACQDSVLCHGYIVTLQHPTPQPSVKTFVLCA